MRNRCDARSKTARRCGVSGAGLHDLPVVRKRPATGQG
nr:MAG TPA: hypothetical protein [Caudoviricetes sp.]